MLLQTLCRRVLVGRCETQRDAAKTLLTMPMRCSEWAVVPERMLRQLNRLRVSGPMSWGDLVGGAQVSANRCMLKVPLRSDRARHCSV